MKFLLRLLVQWLFKYRAYNTQVLSAPGPVLLLPNHASWLDWLFLGVVLDDDWRFVTSSTTAQTSPVHRRMMVNSRTFPIDPASPYAVKRMAEYLSTGGRLVLFPEGRLSRTGGLMKLFDGTGFLLHRTGAKVITCHLRGVKRLPFSPNSEQHLLCPRVSAHFSDLLTPPKLPNASTSAARAALTAWLRDSMVRQQFEVEMEFGATSVPEAIVETASLFPSRVVLQDVTLTKLSYRKFLVGARLLADRIGALLGPASPSVTPGDEMPHRVGVLLPNINAMPVALMALWSLGRIPAVLNFSTGPTIMLACCQLAGLTKVLTSRQFVQKARLDLAPLEKAGLQFLYLEDIRAGIDATERLGALLRSFFGLKNWFLGSMGAVIPAGRTAVILFTSGSEGVPKGVELTHRNLLANARQMLAVTDMQDSDRMFNCLPLFHSFGLTVGTLLPLMRGLFCFVYPSPLHYRVVPAVLYDRDCTILLGTNTFLNGYSRRANPYDFRSLRYLFAAAEKVQQTTSETWARKFGVRILEGYGATECSPCVSVCTPLTPRHGSAGRVVPGMEWKIQPVDGVNEGGRLLVRGPNVMKGYLNEDANRKFLELGGWYDTGDIVKVDEEGFVHILGRLKRFAKVSGEMVSLTAVEDALAGAAKEQLGARLEVAVIAVPDEDKGERLIAVANDRRLTVEHLRAAIKARGLSNLCVPREVQFVREIPKLGTGKVNYRELQAVLAEASTAGPAASPSPAV